MAIKTKINKDISARKALEKTGFTLYVTDEVLENAPKGKGDDIEFFTLGKYVTDDELEKEYEFRGLVPCDLWTLAYAHEKDKNLAEQKQYTATHWKDKEGKWCCVAFDRWGDDGRGVSVVRGGFDWYGDWWFGGSRKKALKHSEPKNSFDTLPLELRVQELEAWKERMEKIFKLLQ